MVDINRWTADFIDKLRAEFGERLRFAGLQGSYRRGEATEKSDIDMVVVLDGLTPADLSRYRALVREMPEADKACGFLCGTMELQAWPRMTVFSSGTTPALCSGAWTGSFRRRRRGRAARSARGGGQPLPRGVTAMYSEARTTCRAGKGRVFPAAHKMSRKDRNLCRRPPGAPLPGRGGGPRGAGGAGRRR